MSGGVSRRVRSGENGVRRPQPDEIVPPEELHAGKYPVQRAREHATAAPAWSDRLADWASRFGVAVLAAGTVPNRRDAAMWVVRGQYPSGDVVEEFGTEQEAQAAKQRHLAQGVAVAVASPAPPGTR